MATKNTKSHKDEQPKNRMFQPHLLCLLVFFVAVLSVW